MTCVYCGKRPPIAEVAPDGIQICEGCLKVVQDDLARIRMILLQNSEGAVTDPEAYNAIAKRMRGA